MIDVDDHGTSSEDDRWATCLGDAPDGEETHLYGGALVEENGLGGVFEELQLEGLKGAAEICFEGFDPYDVVLVGECLDDVVVMVREDFFDIALLEGGTNCIAGFTERLPLLGRALKLIAGWLRLGIAGGEQDGRRYVAGGSEQLSPIHSGQYSHTV
jgi:hypothetical protein